MRTAKVRRAKLYYLRELTGKAARMQSIKVETKSEK
jgi:ribosomal protein L19